MAKKLNVSHRVWRDINSNNYEDSDKDYIDDKNWGNGTVGNTNWKTGKKNDLTSVAKYINDLSESSNILNKDKNPLKTFLDSEGIKDVKQLLTFLSNKGYNGISIDGYAGALTMNALLDYIDREYMDNNEKTQDFLSDNKENPTIGATTLSAIPVTPTPYGVLNKKDYYGQFNNFASMLNFVKNPENKDKPFVRLATDYLNSKGGLNWDSDQSEIEKAFGVKGNYHRGYNGDLYDIGRVLNAFAGEQDAKNKPSSSTENTTKPYLFFEVKPFEFSKPFDLSKPFESKLYESMKLPELTKPELTKPFGFMNYKLKFLQGGAAPQGDPQQQIIQLVQAAMGGDQQATAQIQQIMQAAQQGDQLAAQLAEVIMQVMNQMQGGGPQVARNGAKLNYIKRLKGECPEGYEMAYFKAGGRVCKKCQKKVEKACGGKLLAKCGTKFHKAGGVMENILSEMFAKGGRMNRNKHTAFGEERGANVVSTNHAGRWGGRKAFNANGTHNLNPHDKPNKFSAFGDEGKKKPTNVGLVGHKATGKTGRMQNRQKAGTTYKATAFGGEKQKRFHRGAKASSIGRIGSNGYPKGHGGKSGIGKMADGGSLNGVPFYQGGTSKGGLPTAPKAEDRYKGGRREQFVTNKPGAVEYDRIGVKLVIGPQKGLFTEPALISQTIKYSNVSPTYNDTIYTESPERSTLVSRRLRSASRTNVPFVGPWYGDGWGSRHSNSKDEYQILQRRFNTAWDLAK